MNAVVFICSLVLAQGSAKGEGVLLASFIFGAPVIAPLVALLALPAVTRHRELMWPRFVLALGLTPLPMMFLADRVVAVLRSF
jgi:hypothetical protein